ncbi:MAG: acyltransferase family protein [Akkermansia sp.]|nr:acyltransferase family protein [Akkermansia sp.]
MEERKREPYWDAVKALLIILVVAGHAIQFLLGGNFWSNPVFKGIYMFHMPLFIMVSGYFGIKGIEMRGWGALMRLAQRLLPPVVFLYILRAAISIWMLNLPLSRAVASGDGALWFLVVLLECTLFGCVLMSVRNAVWCVIWLIAPLAVGICAEGILPYATYFTTMWPCYLIGAGMRKLDFRPGSINAKWLVFIPLYAAAYLCFQKEWYMYLTPLDLDAAGIYAWGARLVCAVIGSASFLYVVYLCGAAQSRMLCKLGLCTMAIYVLQALSYKGICMFFPIHCGNTAVALLVGLLVTCCLYLAYRLTRRVKLIARLLYGE